VRSAIERCDGRVDELHAGGQLVVRITVPAMEAPAASMRQAVPGKLDPSASDGKVLLIWNDEVALRCVARVLAPLPSVAVADARAGLARLAEGTVFDAILCQDDAPGISGHDLWRALRLARPADARRLLLLTRREDPSSGPRAMRLPFQPEALRRAVHQLIVEGAAAR
jgi:CheY-like chemotaxis protein